MKTKTLLISLLNGVALTMLVPSLSTAAGSYFKFDAGVSLPQDVEIKEISGVTFPANASQMADLLGVSVPAGTTLEKPKFTFDPGFRADLIGGFKVADPLAIELEVGILYNAFNSVKVSGNLNGTPYSGESDIDVDLWQVPFLANVVYTFLPNAKFRPYIGGGAGGVLAYVTGNDTSENDVTFAFQGLAGVDYALSDSLSLGVAYKFLGTLDHKFGDVKTEAMYTHSLLGAITFKF